MKILALMLLATAFVFDANPGRESKVLDESAKPEESESVDWWLSSGGIAEIEGDSGKTNQGEMPIVSRWRLLYRISNPLDTDNGTHPQNIFRLVSKKQWTDFSQEMYFRILNDNLSESPNRNVSNGVLLMSRYQDQYNLYYAGLRVDGTAIIKKKRNGEYATLAQEKIFPGEYGRSSNPNLLPKNQAIGIRMETRNTGAGVDISLYTDLDGSGEWELAASAMDEPNPLKGPLYGPGFAGIRTDFMDVEFWGYRAYGLSESVLEFGAT